MKRAPNNRCPACWTDYDGQPAACPACGTALGRRSRRSWVWAIPAVAAIGGLFWALPRGDPGVEVENTATPDPGPEPPAPPRATPDPEASPASSWALAPQSDRDPPVIALVLAGPPGAGAPAYLYLPVDAFPLHGGFRTSRPGMGAEALDISVVNWSATQGYVLLSLDGASPQARQLQPRASGSLAPGESLHVDREERVHIIQVQGELLALDREVPRGAPLLDGQDRAVGLTLGGNRALPVDPAIPWLGQPGRQALTELRSELRVGRPELAIEDAAGLLAVPRTANRARQALALLDRAISLSTDRQALLDLEDLRKTAGQILVRELAKLDPPAALAEARQLVARHPDHAGLLADLVVLVVRHGDLLEALGLYDQLLALFPEHATDMAEEVAGGVVAAIRRRIAGQRVQEAVDLASAGSMRFSQRADLRMLHAEVLWRSGRRQEALAEGAVAAALDPTHAAQVESWQASAARDLDPDTVSLPYDPRTRSITTQVSVGGLAVELVVDTGATMTTIPSQLAERLGLVKPDSPVVTVATANGEVQARKVELPSLRLGSITLRGVEAVTLDLRGEMAGKGLLGLNVLEPLNMQIDSANRVLILQRPRERRGRRGG